MICSTELKCKASWERIQRLCRKPILHSQSLKVHCINTKVIDQEQFTRWLIKNKVKLKDWPQTKCICCLYRITVNVKVERALERYVENAMATDYFETFLKLQTDT